MMPFVQHLMMGASAISIRQAIGQQVVVPPAITEPRRYWRLRFASSGAVGVSEVELYGSRNGANYASAGTASASSEQEGAPAAAAFDDLLRVGDDEHHWLSADTAGPHWLMYDFGDTPAFITGVGIAVSPRPDLAAKAPKNFKLQWSDDAEEWTDAINVVDADFADKWFQRFYAPGTAAPEFSGTRHGEHLFWQIATIRSAGPLAAAEITFRASPNGANQATGGTATAHSGADAGNAFDGDGATSWAASTANGWINYIFAAPVGVAEVSWRSVTAGQNPSDLLVRYSDDGVTWTTAYGAFAIPAWGVAETKVFTDPDHAAFRASITIPAGRVTADLTGFPLFVDLADLAPQFWDGVAPDGSDIRIANHLQADLPLDLLDFDKDSRTGSLFVRCDLLTGSDNVLSLRAGAGDALAAPSDPTGRFAVWAGYLAVTTFSDFQNRTGGAPFNVAGRPPDLLQERMHGAAGGQGSFEVANGVMFSQYGVGNLGNQTTIGVSVLLTTNTQRAIAGTDLHNNTLDSHRITICSRSGHLISLWDSSNTWLQGDSFGYVPTRVHARHDGTLERHVIRDGVAFSVDPAVTARGPSTDSFVLGGSQTNAAEPYRGNLAYAYLYNGLLSNAHIKAECLNLRAPAAFYDVDVTQTGDGAVAQSQTFVIPAILVPQALPNFVTRFDLTHLDADVWAALFADGSNLRVQDAAGNTIPFDLVSFEKGEKTGWLYFRKTVGSVDTVFKVVALANGLAYPPRHPLGRNAVWQDYEAMFDFTSLTDRTGKTGAVSISGTVGSFPFASMGAVQTVNVHQGVARDANHNIAIGTNILKRYDSAWVLQQTLTDPLASTGVAGVDHLGDGHIKDGELFVVFENYRTTAAPSLLKHVGVWDAATLEFKRHYRLLDTDISEVSSITWDSGIERWVISNYLRDDRLYVYTADFVFERFITIARPIYRIQGITYWDNHYWITCEGKTLYKLSRDGSTRTLVWYGNINGVMEGIASLDNGEFYILFDGSPSAIYRFADSGIVGLDGWLNVGGVGHGRTAPFGQLPTWTIGATGYASQNALQATLASFGPPVQSTANRASIVQRSGTTWQLWDSSNTWLAAPGGVEVSTPVRSHMVYDFPTERKLYTHGTLKATDPTISQRPSGSVGPALYIGGTDETQVDRFRGSINRVYLREGALSAAWIEAETLNWEGGPFYMAEGTALPSPTNPHRYWRVRAMTNNGDSSYTVIGELELSESTGTPMDGSDATGLGTPMASSGSSGGTGAINAFNDSFSTGGAGDDRYWSSALNDVTGAWLGYDFGSGNAKTIKEVRMLCDRDALRAPRDIRVEFSDNGTFWLEAWAVPEQTGWAIGQWRTFTRPF